MTSRPPSPDAVRSPKRWFHRSALLWTALAAGLLAAQAQNQVPVTAKSRNGQFIVHGRDTVQPPSGGELRPVGDNDVVSLRPDTLAIACDRIRQAIHLQLGAVERPGGAVHLHLRRPRRVEGQLTIVPTAIREGWQYRIDVPEQVEWRRLVRAIVEVVLMDLSNHDLRRTDCVRPPLWLAEGLDSLLVTASGRDLVLEPQTTLNRNERRPDPLAPVRATLSGRDPASFSDLSLPDPGALAAPERFAYYRASATLLVFELLRDDEGRSLARDFLHQLPYHLNWQTAFLRASNGRFQTLLDAEKWWAVGAADVLSRDPSLLWPRDRVLSELQLVLTETADVRGSTNGPVSRQTLGLSEVVRTWGFPAQQEVLRRKANQLVILGLHTPPDLMPLVTECQRTIEGYVNSRANAGTEGSGRLDIAARAKVLAKTAAAKLDELGRQLAAARAKRA